MIAYPTSPIGKLRAFSLIGLLLLLWTPPALAANDFKTHYQLAIALYEAQRYDEAIIEFKAAYKVDPKAGLLFNIAQSYRKAGQPRDAVDYYDRYLQSAPQIDSETRHKVDGYLAEARNTLAGLELELKRRLAEQKATREQEVKATPPQPDPELAPERASAAAEPVAPAQSQINPPSPISPSSPAPLALVVPAAAPPPPIYKRWWFWTAVGGAVTVGVVGAVVGTQVHATPQVPDTYSRGTVIF